MQVLSSQQIDQVAGAGLLSLFGVLAQTAHHTAENLVTASGLRSPITNAIDYAVVHPLLWTPLEKLTGVDVDSHP